MTRVEASSDHIRSRVDQIHTSLSSVSEEPAELEPTQTAANSQLEVSARFSSLQTAIGSLNTGLETRHDSINSSLSFLQTRLNTLESGLTSHHKSGNSKLNSLRTRLNTLKSGLDSHHESGNSSLSSLHTGLDSLKTGMISQLAEVNSRLESVSDGLDGLAAVQNSTPSEPKDLPRDCTELPVRTSSGVHLLQLSSDSPPVEAYCDMDTDGGGWTVFQRRDFDIHPPEEDFHRAWAEYRAGFGNLTGEFWWGLDKLWLMTSPLDRRYELRVDLEDFRSKKGHAIYQNFKISSESDGYRMDGSDYTGNSGDGLTENFGQKFSTKDRDHDTNAQRNCANEHMGGWWYSDCGHDLDTNLNGLQRLELSGINWNRQEIVWYGWQGSVGFMKIAEMKIRRVIS